MPLRCERSKHLDSRCLNRKIGPSGERALNGAANVWKAEARRSPRAGMGSSNAAFPLGVGPARSHVAANILYLVWKRDNLIGAMLSGSKPSKDVGSAGGRTCPNMERRGL